MPLPVTPDLMRATTNHHGRFAKEKRPKCLIHLSLSGVRELLRTLLWWSRGELNPRPQAIARQIYMLSALI
jgi:hypothetical protein